MSSMTRFGFITADDTETQINNLSTEITVIGSNLSSHVASSTVHGIQNGSVVVGTTDSQTLTNKTLTSPNISSIINSGTLTLPTSTDTLVGRNTTDQLQIKQ